MFRDVEDIDGGSDFGDVLKDNLADADAVIVLIGPDWLATTDAKVSAGSTTRTTGWCRRLPRPSRPANPFIRY